MPTQNTIPRSGYLNRYDKMW